jgi:hypothetical protein
VRSPRRPKSIPSIESSGVIIFIRRGRNKRRVTIYWETDTMWIIYNGNRKVNKIVGNYRSR